MWLKLLLARYPHLRGGRITITQTYAGLQLPADLNPQLWGKNKKTWRKKNEIWVYDRNKWSINESSATCRKEFSRSDEEFARSMIFLGCNSPLLISSFFSQARKSLSLKSRSVRLPQGTSKAFFTDKFGSVRAFQSLRVILVILTNKADERWINECLNKIRFVFNTHHNFTSRPHNILNLFEISPLKRCNLRNTQGVLNNAVELTAK